MNKIRLCQNDPTIAFHNVAEIERTRRGLRLQRIESTWRDRLPEQTAFRATHAGGVELRFRANTRHIALDAELVTLMGQVSALALYHGCRNVGLATVPSPRFRGHVVLMDRDADIDDVLDRPWRIVLPYGAQATISALYLSDGAQTLAPEPRRTRWLAHGDSITHGAHALHPGMTYVNLVADMLGWDALNLGFGGAAWGDAVVAEYIASRDDWDILSLAIGTNTFGQGTDSARAFATKYARFLDIIRKQHPTKPILCITPFWRSQDIAPALPNALGCTMEQYRQAIEQVVQSRQAEDPALGLMNGLEAISDERGLTVDRLHPDAHGMRRIAKCLAPHLQELASVADQRE